MNFARNSRVSIWLFFSLLQDRSRSSRTRQQENAKKKEILHNLSLNYLGKTLDIAKNRQHNKSGKDGHKRSKSEEDTAIAKALNIIVNKDGQELEGDAFAIGFSFSFLCFYSHSLLPIVFFLFYSFSWLRPHLGGFLTESSATRGFGERILKRFIYGRETFSEETGNIFVKDRHNGSSLNKLNQILQGRERLRQKIGVIFEERMPGFVRMGIRVLYQNNRLNDAFLALFHRTLRKMTLKQGTLYTDPQSAKHIKPFIDFHQIDMSEYEDSVDSFANFNEFFYRKIKPECRPVAEKVTLFPLCFLASMTI